METALVDGVLYTITARSEDGLVRHIESKKLQGLDPKHHLYTLFKTEGEAELIMQMADLGPNGGYDWFVSAKCLHAGRFIVVIGQMGFGDIVFNVYDREFHLLVKEKNCRELDRSGYIEYGADNRIEDSFAAIGERIYFTLNEGGKIVISCLDLSGSSLDSISWRRETEIQSGAVGNVRCYAIGQTLWILPTCKMVEENEDAPSSSGIGRLGRYEMCMHTYDAATGGVRYYVRTGDRYMRGESVLGEGILFGSFGSDLYFFDPKADGWLLFRGDSRFGPLPRAWIF